MLKIACKTSETFTGLYWQVCKYTLYGAIFQLACSQKYCQIHDANTQKLKYFELKSENKHEHIDFDNTCGYKLCYK